MKPTYIDRLQEKQDAKDRAEFDRYATPAERAGVKALAKRPMIDREPLVTPYNSKLELVRELAQPPPPMVHEDNPQLQRGGFTDQFLRAQGIDTEARGLVKGAPKPPAQTQPTTTREESPEVIRSY